MTTDLANPIFSEKRVDAHADVHELIRTRWSPRAFSSREVSNSDLKAVLEAGRWAASSYNEQPWRFFVARKSEGAAYSLFLDILAPANRKWASNAPVLMIMATKRTFSHNGAPNYYALHDAGQALAQVMLQATALGLHAHAMAGFDREKARKDIGISDDYDIGAAVALGYLGNSEESTEQARRATRTRKPLNEIAFGSRWNEPLRL